MQDMLLETAEGEGYDAIDDIVHSSSRLSAARHLGIYKSSYIARLREVMRTQFSALAFALGNELFDAFADQYLQEYPSGSYTLNSLGEKFPTFLAATRPDANEEVKESWPDFMIELASFEYALSAIFDEQATPNGPIADETTPDDALRLSPVFHLFRHQYPVCRYYLDFKQDKNPDLPFPAESYCVVNRVNFQLGLFEIMPAHFHFLSILKDVGSIQEAKAQLASRFGVSAGEIERVWVEWKRYFLASKFFGVG
jgi:hypothetical protein